MKLSTLTIAALLGTLSLYAQDPLVTDRPDQTESSSVVGQGVVQIETGVVFGKADNAPFEDDKFNDYLTTLVRVGLSDKVEVRLVTSYSTFEYMVGEETFKSSGLSPVAFGMKVHLFEEKGIMPEIAFLGHITTPWIGDDAFKPTFIAPDFRFAFAHTISDRFSLGYNLGFEWDGEDANAAFIYTLAVGAGIAGNLSAFLEVYGSAPEDRDARHEFDAGFTYLVNPDFQLDMSYGFSLSDPSASFVNAGLSWRLGAKK